MRSLLPANEAGLLGSGPFLGDMALLWLVTLSQDFTWPCWTFLRLHGSKEIPPHFPSLSSLKVWQHSTFLQLPNQILRCCFLEAPGCHRLIPLLVMLSRLREPKENLVFRFSSELAGEPRRQKTDRLGKFQHACQQWAKSVLRRGIFRRKYCRGHVARTAFWKWSGRTDWL